MMINGYGNGHGSGYGDGYGYGSGSGGGNGSGDGYGSGNGSGNGYGNGGWLSNFTIPADLGYLFTEDSRLTIPQQVVAAYDIHTCPVGELPKLRMFLELQWVG